MSCIKTQCMSIHCDETRAWFIQPMKLPITHVYLREKSIFKSGTTRLLPQATVTNYFSAFLSTAKHVFKTP